MKNVSSIQKQVGEIEDFFIRIRPRDIMLPDYTLKYTEGNSTVGDWKLQFYEYYKNFDIEVDIVKDDEFQSIAADGEVLYDVRNTYLFQIK